MEKLFGIPMDSIALVLVITFVIVMGFVAVLAWRNRIMLKLGIRNIPRRPAQTALIVFGLMLSTIITTAAFGTGDTIVYTIKSLAARGQGNTDEIVGKGTSAFGTSTTATYFQYSQFETLHDELAGYDRVDGLLPVISERAPLVNMTTRQNESRILVFAPDPGYLSFGFGQMTTQQGGPVHLSDLGANEVYLDEEAAENLNAEPDHDLHLFVAGKPTVFRMKAIVKNTSAGGSPALVMPLSRAQALWGKQSQINAIYVSNRGDLVAGAELSDEVKARINPLLEGTGLEVRTVKKNTLEEADTVGSIFTTMFVGFGLFSISAGLLLIFLIFTMLAAARKSEMGMARAVGAKRNHLVQMFIFEGVPYDLGAALVGIVLGIAVTYGMAGIMARMFSDTPLDLAYHIEPRSLVVSFVLGMLITFVTVAFSSWRVSRLNIVRAIRDIPEPKLQRVGRWWLVSAILLLLVGALSTLSGFSGKQGAPFTLGVSLLIVGLALLLRWFGLGERATFSLAGIALLVWWLLPMDISESLFGEMKAGIEMFFISGMMMVLGAVWVVSYNLSILFRLLNAVLGRLTGITPALKTAIAYPMSSRMRTGLTLAMFSLVIFTMIFMSVVISASMGALRDVEAFSGGYDVWATASYNNPIPDIQDAVSSAAGVDANDFEAIASQSTLPVEIRQVGVVDQEWYSYAINGLDNVYLDTNGYEFVVMAEGYGSAREIWQALKEKPGLAVISADTVPSRNEYSIVVGGTQFRLEGLYQEDKVMSPTTIETKEPLTGSVTTVTVIGVLDPVSYNYGLYTSQDTLSTASPFPLPPTTYLFKLKQGVDAKATAQAIEAEFLVNGMEANSAKAILDQISSTSYTMNTLLQGFMSLGLVVGIAALGVISTRAVVERRHEIGVLRAIGYQQRTVQLSFLLESSIVALLGILIGVALALALSYNVISSLAEQEGGLGALEFQIPWVQTLIIAAVAYVASLLMTFLPSRQAAKIYPAEALRYE